MPCLRVTAKWSKRSTNSLDSGGRANGDAHRRRRALSVDGRNLTFGMLDRIGRATLAGHNDDAAFPTKAHLATQDGVSCSVLASIERRDASAARAAMASLVADVGEMISSAEQAA